MPDDIVQRLRSLGHPKEWQTPGHPMNGWVSAYEAQAIGKAAADEIDGLREHMRIVTAKHHAAEDEVARARALISWIDGACTDQRPHADIEAAITRWKDEQGRRPEDGAQ